MSNSVVTLSSFNLLFFTQVLTVLTSTIKYNEYVTDKGKNISIACDADSSNIMWIKENDNYSTIVQTGKYLVLTNVTTSDEGFYVCFAAITAPILSSTAIQIDDKVTDNDETSAKNSPIATEFHLINTSSSSSSSLLLLLNVNDSNNNFSYELFDNNSMMTTTKNASTTSVHSALEMNSNKQLTNEIVSVEGPASAISNRNNSNSTYIASSNRQRNSSVYSDHSSVAKTTTTTTTTASNELIEQAFRAIQRIHIKVRTTPGPVSQLYFKASTILGFLIWRFNPNNSGGYTVRSFTAEYRNISYKEKPFNSSFEHEWIRMDPINIAPNVRQMEVYHLEPNTTYEFRIWANNQLGSGEIVTTNVTTLPETKEEDLIRLIQDDLDNFDPRVWIIAVSIVLGTFMILAIGLCVVLMRECYQSSRQEFQDGWDGIELIPNIILNPGFHESDSDGNEAIPYLRTIVFRNNDNNNNHHQGRLNNNYYYNYNNNNNDDDDSYDSESDNEPRIEKFKRKLSVFFTDPTIRRI